MDLKTWCFPILRLRLVERKTFSWKAVFLYLQFYIIWFAKECKNIFLWGKISLLMMENHFPFKIKGKLFSLLFLVSFVHSSHNLLTFPFDFSFISSFFLHWTKQRKTNFGIVFSMKIILHWKCFTSNQTEPNLEIKKELASLNCCSNMPNIDGSFARLLS